MNFLTLVLTALLFLAPAHGQVRKCTMPDGKVTYSDVLCSNSTVREAAVNTKENSLDTSAIRQHSAKIKAEGEIADGMQNAPIECKFKSFNNNDDKGKVLADKAQLECVKNIQAKKSGQPTSTDDYAMWKDHFEQESQKRQAMLQRLTGGQCASGNLRNGRCY